MLPSIRTDPVRRGTSSSRARKRVVLPPPFGPSTATIRPAGTLKVSPEMAGEPLP